MNNPNAEKLFLQAIQVAEQEIIALEKQISEKKERIIAIKLALGVFDNKNNIEANIFTTSKDNKLEDNDKLPDEDYTHHNKFVPEGINFVKENGPKSNVELYYYLNKEKGYKIKGKNPASNMAAHFHHAKPFFFNKETKKWELAKM